MTAGKVYRFRLRCKNSANIYSPWSDNATIATGTTPSAPSSAPTLKRTSRNAIVVQWSESSRASGDLPITGYVLYSALAS